MARQWHGWSMTTDTYFDLLRICCTTYCTTNRSNEVSVTSASPAVRVRYSPLVRCSVKPVTGSTIGTIVVDCYKSAVQFCSYTVRRTVARSTIGLLSHSYTLLAGLTGLLTRNCRWSHALRRWKIACYGYTAISLHLQAYCPSCRPTSFEAVNEKPCFMCGLRL